MTLALRKSKLPAHWTVADLRRHLGGISAKRIRLYPSPGEAAIKDVVKISNREGRLFELVDGILVEKVMGWYESLVASILVRFIGDYLKTHDLGQVLLPDATLRILSDQVRIPDVSFISWARLPKGTRKQRRKPVPRLAPDLAVEIISEGNTKREMDRKLREYFKAGVRLVWFIDADDCTAVSYSGLDDATEIGKNGKLNGGDVLPGFTLSLRELFDEADRQGPK